MSHYTSSDLFTQLAKAEGDLILTRDEEDATKLQVGIDYAKDKGVLEKDYVAEAYISVDVLGKSPDEVADEILGHATGGDGDGGVIVICGLSGTGKGTTVAKIRQKLMENEGKDVVCWSNGNIFRSVTLLAATWCEQQEGSDGSFDAEKALTKENLADFMNMLSFGKFNGKFDTKINGLGLDLLVSEVQNTQLKAPKVAKNIPTVAQVTQGEVILFADKAIQVMGADGIFVLLEGREQTVDFVRTPHRFILTLSDESLIGKRRAAQRLMAGALKELEGGEKENGDVIQALDGQLASMVKEIGN